jgi:CheY-like chemotaxis protein
MARLLVVDDEEAVRALIARGLQLDGHEVRQAADGAEALDVLAAGQGGFDLLLTDIRMPIMDGIALALAAKRDFPALLIVLMTGYAEQRERARSLEAVVAEVMTKPFGIAELRATIAQVLSGAPRPPLSG